MLPNVKRTSDVRIWEVLTLQKYRRKCWNVEVCCIWKGSECISIDSEANYIQFLYIFRWLHSAENLWKIRCAILNIIIEYSIQAELNCSAVFFFYLLWPKCGAVPLEVIGLLRKTGLLTFGQTSPYVNMLFYNSLKYMIQISLKWLKLSIDKSLS